MNENDLRDCFAMFAMLGLVSCGKAEFDMEHMAGSAYKLADAMLKARSEEPEQEVGIVAVKSRRKKND
jgi:hypothetical protein